MQECWKDNVIPIRCYKENCRQALSLKTSDGNGAFWYLTVTDRGNKGEGECTQENAAANGTAAALPRDFWAGKLELLGSSVSLCLSEGCCVNEKWFELKKSDWRWRAGGLETLDKEVWTYHVGIITQAFHPLSAAFLDVSLPLVTLYTGYNVSKVLHRCVLRLRRASAPCNRISRVPSG